MLANLPDETTQILIDICTGTGPLAVEAEDMAPTKKPAPSYLSYLALSRVQPGTSDAVPPSPSIATARPDEPSQPRKIASAQEMSRISTPVPGSIDIKPPPERYPSPRKYFSHFVDNMQKFMVFLEAVALRRWGQAVDDVAVSLPETLPAAADEDSDRLDQEAVWQTLLELYLTLGEDEGQEGPLRRKALALLKSTSIPYDTMHALMLCTTRDFTPGLVLLWEKLGMFEDVVRFWIAQENEEHVPGASAEVLKALRRYGPENHHLYPIVLRFLTSNAELLSRHSKELEDILETIEQEKIMPPLGVIQVLSRNDVASVGLLKNWLLLRIQNSRKEIETVSSSVYFMLAVSRSRLIGPGAHRLVPKRDASEAQASRRPLRSGQRPDIPRHPLCAVFSAARPPRRALHVQPQLPPALSPGQHRERCNGVHGLRSRAWHAKRNSAGLRAVGGTA